MPKNNPVFDTSNLPDQEAPKAPSLVFDMSNLPDQPAVPPELRPAKTLSSAEEMARDSGSIRALHPYQDMRPLQDAADSYTALDDFYRNAYGDGPWNSLMRLIAPNRPMTDADRARAANTIALADQFNKPVLFAHDHYDELNQAVGWYVQPPPHVAIPQMIMYGGGLATAGAAPAAWWTLGNVGRAALGVTGYFAEEAANSLVRSFIDKTPYWETRPYSLQDLAGPEGNEALKTLLAVADIYAKGASVHAGFTGLQNAWNSLAYETMSKLVPSQKLYISAEDIRNHFGAGTEGGTGQYYDILQKLDLTNGQVKDAAKYGLDVEIPLSGVVVAKDAPWWGQIKSLLKMTPFEETTEIPGGKPTGRLHVSGELEAPGEQPEAAEAQTSSGTGEVAKAGEAVPEGENLPAGQMGATVQDRMSQAMAFFQGKGWTKEQAAGIVGNLMGEDASLLPGTIEAGSGAGYGLAQHTGTRRDALFNYAAERGENEPSFQTQLEFIQHELETSHTSAAEALRSSTDVKTATEAILKKFEMPKDQSDAVLDKRAALAQKALGAPGGSFPAGMSRQQFADALSKNTTIPKDQKDAFMAIMDARARSWAETEGRTPDEWFGHTFAGVLSGEAQEGALAQYGGEQAVGFSEATGKFSSLYDKMQRFEIDDSKAQILPLDKIKSWGTREDMKAGNSTVALLSDVLEHKDLFKQYPEAKNISVHLVPDKKGASFSPEENTIQIGYDRETGVVHKANLFHEIQHWIQEREGFAKGSSPESAMRALGPEPSPEIVGAARQVATWAKTDSGGVDEVMKKLPKYLRHLADSDAVRYLAKNPEELKKAEKRLKAEPIDAYRRTSGEIEARDTTSRSDLTDEQRASIPPYSSEDISPSDAILLQAQKGAVQFLNDGRAILHLFETSDASTLIHEFGHILRRQLSDQDMAIAEKWLKVPPGGEWKRAQEEKFARGFEAYVMEGVAPSAGLRSIFQKMKQWLLDIYHSIRNLKVRLNDDIRAVFDRILSTEAERRANVLYQMNDEYDGAPQGSLEAQAVERAGKRVEEMESKIRKQAERELRKEAEAQYQELQEPKIVKELMGRGLSRESLRSWDDDTVKELMRRWPGLVRSKGGWGVDKAADMHGYPSDDALVSALLNAPTKAQFVEGHIAQGMTAYGDELQLGELDLLAARVQAEIDILKEGEPGAKEWTVATMPEQTWKFVQEEYGRRVTDILSEAAGNYETYKAAIVKAQQEAKAASLDALRRGKEIGREEGMREGKALGSAEAREAAKAKAAALAVRDKQKVLERIARLKARISAAEEVRKMTAKIRKISGATNLPLDYREQIAGILSTVGARQIRTEAPAERIPLSQWVADKEQNDGEIFDIPFDILEGLRGKTIRDMTMEELHTLHNVVNEIYTHGRNAGVLLSGAQKAEVEIEASKMAARIAEKHSANEIAGRSIKYDGEVYPLIPTPGMSPEQVQTVFGLRGILEYGSKEGAITSLQELIDDKETPEEMRESLQQQLDGVKSLDESKIKMPPPTLRPWAVKESRIKRIAGMGDRILSELLEMETVLSWADGFTEEFGPNWTGIYKAINDGYNDLYRLNNEDLPALEGALKPFKTKVGGLSSWANKKMAFKELGGAVLTKTEMMSWALNMGNEGNYNALKRSFKVNGRPLSDEQVRVVVDKLTREEWEAVVKLGRLVDSIERYNQMTGVYEKVTGNRMTKVEGWKVDTPAGQVDGWYYPLIDDPQASYKMEKRFAANENRDLFSTRYNPKSPRSGFTIKRRNQADHILDMNFPGVVARFIQDRNRYIALTLPVRDAQKLANNDTWRNTVESYLGKDFHRMVMPWLQDMARPMSTDTTFIERTLSELRRRATMVHIGLKIITAVKHYPMLATAIDRLGLPTVAKAMSVYMRHPIGTRQFIEQRDPFMANLMAKWDRDIGEQWKNFDPERSEAKALVTKAAFMPIDTVIGQVARITWLAAYKKAMDNFEWDEAKAVDYAQKAVRDTIGTFEPKDLAAVRRGSELRKLFTMFYPYGATIFQREFERAAQIGIEGTTGTEEKASSGWWRGMSAVRSFLWILGLGALVDQILSKRRLPNSPGEVAKGVTAGAANSIPFARDIAGAAMGERPYEISPAAGLGHSVTEIAKPVFSGQPTNWNRHLFENSLSALGYLFDLPTDQAAITLEGAYNWAQGKGEPWNVVVKPPAQEQGRHHHGRRLR
jgi:hypothetical protein